MWPSACAIGIALALQTAPPKPVATPWPDSQPLTHILQNLVTDARHLPSVTSLEILVTGSAGAAIAGTRDREVADWAARQGPSSYTQIGDIIGLGAVQAGAALGTYAVGKLAHKPAVTHIGGDLIRAQILTGVLTLGLKVSVDRTRPNGASHSFPSGHTSATFASASVLGQHFGWKVAVPAYATASFVGWTRIRDHAHYPSDVIFGATLGVIVGTTVTHGHRAWTVVPVRTAGGFGVYVTRTR